MNGQRARVAALAILIAVAACNVNDGTQSLTTEQVQHLEPKMRATEVERILGRPLDKGESTWVYRPSEGPYEEVEISFDDREQMVSYHVSER